MRKPSRKVSRRLTRSELDMIHRLYTEGRPHACSQHTVALCVNGPKTVVTIYIHASDTVGGGGGRTDDSK